MAGTFYSKKASIHITALALGLAYLLGQGVSAAPATQAQAAPVSPSKIEASKLVINIPSRSLWVYSGTKIVRYFPVGLGKPGYMTPVGRYSVTSKIIDPGWEHPYLPTGKVRIAPGADNPLGTRWIGFYNYKGGEFGMHGTDRPISVGKFSSHGCVRMKIRDAEALFEMFEVGTPVEVAYETVLIRPKGHDIRIIVYPDIFKKGMPSVDHIITDIKKEHPDAKVNLEKVKTALAHPTQQPVLVGQFTDSSKSTAAETPQFLLPPLTHKESSKDSKD